MVNLAPVQLCLPISDSTSKINLRKVLLDDTRVHFLSVWYLTADYFWYIKIIQIEYYLILEQMYLKIPFSHSFIRNMSYMLWYLSKCEWIQNYCDHFLLPSINSPSISSIFKVLQRLRPLLHTSIYFFNKYRAKNIDLFNI